MRPCRLLAPLLAATVLVACTSEPDPAPTPSPSAAPAALATNDPDREALAATTVELRTTVGELRTALEAAAAGDDDALDTAIVLLVAEPEQVTTVPVDTGDDEAAAPAEDAGDGTGDDVDATDGTATGDDTTAVTPAGGPAPILPGPLTSREESIQYGDLLTRTLAAARGAGSAGEPALRFLADPLAGDLGAWQRAPADQLDAIARAGTAPDLAATEAAVLDLAGEAPRALAWVVHGLTVPGDAEDAAGRALAHLAIIELALDQLE